MDRRGWRRDLVRVCHPEAQMKTNLPVFRRAVYFDIQKAWRRIGPLFRSPEAESIWRPCMREYAEQRAESYGGKYQERFTNTLPSHYDSCDWRFERRGRAPGFWDFVCHSACHWVVDLCLYVAKTKFPQIAWRITTSQKHSTVWDGDRKQPLLFDVNFLALDVSPTEALKLACRGRELKPGRYLKPYLHHSP